MSTLSEKFSKIAESIDEKVTDFTTLDVVTISGNIQSIIKADGKYLKPIDLIKNFDPKADATKVKVEAFTHIDFDQDMIQFYRDGLKPDDFTYTLHQDAVESSKAARLAMLAFITEMI